MKEKKRKNIKKKKSFTTRTAGNVCLCHNGFFFLKICYVFSQIGLVLVSSLLNCVSVRVSMLGTSVPFQFIYYSVLAFCSVGCWYYSIEALSIVIVVRFWNFWLTFFLHDDCLTVLLLLVHRCCSWIWLPVDWMLDYGVYMASFVLQHFFYW